MAKKVLNENTIRRFMKLASLGPLSGTFINEAYGEEEEVDEGMLGSVVGGVEDMVTGARDEEEIPGEELPGEELPGDEEETPEENKEELARTALEAVAAAFTSLGVDVDVSGDEEELDGPMPEEDPLEGGDDLGIEDPALEEAEVEEGLASMAGKAVGGLAGGPIGAAAGGALGGMAGDALAGDDEEEDLTESIMNLLAKADIEVVDDDKLRESLVKKVATRVVKRLLKERS